jgi:MFS family permease
MAADRHRRVWDATGRADRTRGTAGRAAGSAGRAAGSAGRAAGSAGRAAGSAGRWTLHLVHRTTRASGAGRTGLADLIELTAVSSAGDAFVAVSLAGTLFFNASLNQARGQVALYLAVTMAPFAVLAPLIGPMLDRLRQGRRFIMSGTLIGRGLLCWGMAGAVVHHDTVTLLPAAFGSLVLSKAYGITRTSVTPRLLPTRISLVTANSRCSLAALIAAAIAAPVAAGVAVAVHADWVLRVASVIFVAGAALGLRLPEHVDTPAAEPATAAGTAAGTAPGTGPAAGPDGWPSAGPDTVPTAGPETVPTAGPDTVPSAGPDTVPTTGPETVPTAGPDTVPTAGPDTVPTAGPETVPTAGPIGGPAANGRGRGGPGSAAWGSAGPGFSGAGPTRESAAGSGGRGRSGTTAGVGGNGRSRRDHGLRTARTLRSVGPVVGEAMRANAVLRAFFGFTEFYLAFLLREDHFHGVSNKFALGALVGALAIGAMAGTGLGSLLKTRAPHLIMFGMLAITTAITLFTAIAFGLLTAVVVAFTASLAQALVKLGQDSTVQREIGEEVRSSTFAVSETLNQLSWVAGGLIGLVLSFATSGTLGMAIAGAGLALALGGLLAARRRRKVSRDAAAKPAPAGSHAPRL